MVESCTDCSMTINDFNCLFGKVWFELHKQRHRLLELPLNNYYSSSKENPLSDFDISSQQLKKQPLLKQRLKRFQEKVHFE